MESEIVVVGGGMAGIFAAAKAALDGAKVTLLEKNSDILLRFSQDKHSEMLTNFSQRLRFQSRITRGSKFMETALKLFSPNKLLVQLEGIGIPINTVDSEFIYSAEPSDVTVKKLRKWLENCGVKIYTDATVTQVNQKDGMVTGVEFDKDGKSTIVETSAVILSTGGMGTPESGATGDGYAFLESLDHHTLPPTPSLVPLKLDETIFNSLSGLTLKDARLYLWSEGKKVDDRRGAVTFVDGGISGDASLDLSSTVMENPKATLTLELLPSLDEGKFDKEITGLCEKDGSISVGKLIANFLPKRIVSAVLAKAGIPEETTGGTMSGKQRKALRGSIFRMPLAINGTFPVEMATDTAGGADISAINPNSMESYVCSGLFIAGELLDVTTRWGGYSMHTAISTGRLAGMSAVRSIKEN